MIQMLLPWALAVLVLIVSTINREQDRKEREQLVNRIMAKDYGEFTRGTQPPPKQTENHLKASIRKAYQGRFEPDEDE